MIEGKATKKTCGEEFGEKYAKGDNVLCGNGTDIGVSFDLLCKTGDGNAGNKGERSESAGEDGFDADDPVSYTHLLECVLLEERYETVMRNLLTEIEITRVKREIQGRVKENVDKNCLLYTSRCV